MTTPTTTSANTIVKQTNDITVLADGSTRISQRKLAGLLGVNPKTLTTYVIRKLPMADTSLGLDESVVANVTFYFAVSARNTTDEAKALLQQITQAGVRAFIYSQVGYSLTPLAQPKSPMEIAATMNSEQLGLLTNTVKANEANSSLVQKKNTPQTLSTLLGNQGIVNAACHHLEAEGLIASATDQTGNTGWVLTQQGKDLGYGVQAGKIFIKWTADILNHLPPVDELKELARALRKELYAEKKANSTKTIKVNDEDVHIHYSKGNVTKVRLTGIHGISGVLATAIGSGPHED